MDQIYQRIQIIVDILKVLEEIVVQIKQYLPDISTNSDNWRTK